jgi:hypothetical protein
MRALAAAKSSAAQEEERHSIKESQKRKDRQIKDKGWQKAYHEKTSPLSKTRHIQYLRRQTFSSKSVQGRA